MKKNLDQLKKRIQKFPVLPGVYIMKKDEENILYVGKAKSLRTRLRSYFNEKSLNLKTQFLMNQTEKIDYLVTENEVEAFLLESSLIKKHKPRYNIRLKDDKAYPYIRLSIQNKFPRFYFERRVTDQQSLYFGPFTEGFSVRNLIDFLNQNFHLRDCSDSDFKTRTRPCLSWEMGYCQAPCVKIITEKSYEKNCKQALQFLNGGTAYLTKKLKSKMEKFSKALRFEEAGFLRDRLRAIQMMEQNQSVIKKNDLDSDVIVIKSGEQGLLIEMLHFRKGKLIGNRFHFFKRTIKEEEFLVSFLNQYYSENLIPDELFLKMPIKNSRLRLLEKVLKKRKGSLCLIRSVFNKEDQALIKMAEKNSENHFQNEIDKTQTYKDILIEIKKRFHLKNIPHRIECYDISHWQGSQTIGSQVVFENGIPAKKEYRRYQLKTVSDGDDYLALQEVLSRRLNHKEYQVPDMILIDGGRGQLKAVQTILKKLNKKSIPFVSLAKDRIKNKKKTYTSQIESSGERFYLPNQKNPVVFSSHSKALKVLLYLRDEAHRFAIESHRKQRDKNFLTSDLDKIKGLGPKKKQALLKHYGSLESLNKASEKELSSLSFISQTLAKKIKHCFSN